MCYLTKHQIFEYICVHRKLHSVKAMRGRVPKLNSATKRTNTLTQIVTLRGHLGNIHPLCELLCDLCYHCGYIHIDLKYTPSLAELVQTLS